MLPTRDRVSRLRRVSFALWVSCLACGENEPNQAVEVNGNAGAASVEDSSYAGNGAAEGECRSGQTRCHGELGFQRCTPEGAWGLAQTCAGYSEDGTSSYCLDQGTAEEPYAACVDPACWFWLASGLWHEGAVAGVCTGDSAIKPCNSGGIVLSERTCAGRCQTLAQLDGRALGYCVSECRDGEHECVSATEYRECAAGAWSATVSSCDAGQECQPIASGELREVRCASVCDPGTSRCSADRSAIETCDDQGAWQAAEPCALGRCISSGPVAQCQLE